MRVIVSGKVYVEAGDRDRFVEGYRHLVEKAREAPGCLDLAISPDAFEPGRVNIFEYWESRETLDAWRAIAPAPKVRIPFKAEVFKHEIAKSGPPFD